MYTKYKTIEDCLLSRIEKTPTCWLWKGQVHRNGYGQLRFRRKAYSTHRVSYELFKGPIPKGLVIDHLCRVRNCVNPEHLEAVTTRVNILRGESPSALSAKKTHCPKGHPYDAENTYSPPSKQNARHCRECNRVFHRINGPKYKQYRQMKTTLLTPVT